MKKRVQKRIRRWVPLKWLSINIFATRSSQINSLERGRGNNVIISIFSTSDILGIQADFFSEIDLNKHTGGFFKFLFFQYY